MIKKSTKRRGLKFLAVICTFAMLFSVYGCSSRMFEYNKGVSESTEDAGPGTDPDDGQGTTSGNKTGGKVSYTDAQKEFEEFLFAEYVDSVTSDTLTYNYEIKNGDEMGIPEPEVGLGDDDMSPEGIEKDKSEFDETFEKLKSFDRDELAEDQQLTYDILMDYMENEQVAYDYIYLYDPFSPMKGLQANIATYFTDYRFDDKGDVERYLQVLGMVRDYFGIYLDFEKTKSEKGYFMSDDVCDSVIEQCQDFISNADNHFMVSVFNDNIEALDFLQEDEIASFEEENEKIVKESLLPAFQDVIDVLTSLKGTGKNDKGLCYYDGGKEYYTYLMRKAAGTDKTPEEVAAMLDENLSSLMTEMYTIMLSDAEAFSYLSEHFDNMFSGVDNMSPEEVVNLLMDTATEHYPDMDKIKFTAKPLEKSLEEIQESTLAYYMSPAYDDQDNNLIRVNGKHTDGMWTTLAHEGYPGHMLQNAYFMSLEPEPIRTTLPFLGYKEGWAMYACYDAVSYYDFEGIDDPTNVAKLYQINDELNYLLCGRLDIGIHYEGWTVEETKEYLINNGMNGEVAQELYTSLVGDPAVYQSYSTGYYEMKELRDYAEEQLGDKFDAKEFNTAVLDAGPCQYSILKQQIDKYIEEKM